MSGKINLTILVAPLDWGLGHATRCVPIITQLLQLGCKVIIAAEGAQEKLLKTEFPDLKFVHLPGYRIKYSKSKRFFSLKILVQLPKIALAIKSEQKWIHDFITHTPVDAIISDNRYGFYHATMPSVFITHQLLIKGPSPLVERWVQNINYQLIEKFSACWIPDEAGPVNLGGDLSHPKKLPRLPVQYLGALTRLAISQPAVGELDLLVILSGPEPQRTLLERKIVGELAVFTGKVLLVRGLPGDTESISAVNMTTENHLPADELAQWISKSKYILSRSGCTTVMDICKLGKKAALIPAPGQTEQEYLARHLEEQGWCIHIPQDQFTLATLLRRISSFEYKLPQLGIDGFREVVRSFVENVGKS